MRPTGPRSNSISDAELDEIVRNDPDDVYLAEAELADAVPIYPVDLKKLRRRLGLTQESFAARFGFSLGTLRNWERGRRRPGRAGADPAPGDRPRARGGRAGAGQETAGGLIVYPAIATRARANTRS